MSFAIISLLAIVLVIAVALYRRRPGQHLPTAAMVAPVLREPVKHSRAAVLRSKAGPYTVVHDWPRPTISHKELLIKNQAIGLNPIDWKCVTYGFGVHSIPWISGREAAGTVEEVGSEVHGFQKGDRVFVTSTNYRDNRTSTFQEYVAAFPFNVGRIPDWISFEEAVTLGVGSVAAAGALFEGLNIPRPPTRSVLGTDVPSLEADSPWILIWGGSCVTGIMALQLAKQSGFRVLAISGIHNAAYLQGLGADRVLDRHRPEEAIAEAKRLDIRLGVDCVGQQTATYAVQALQPGGRLVYLVKKPEAAVVEASNIEVTDILIKRFHEDATYGQSLMDYISHGLFSKAIRPVRHEVFPGGLEAVESGLAKLKGQAVSGRKLVIRVDHHG